MNINRYISRYNFNQGNTSRIKYIVIHYVGATGTAEENCKYFAGGDRQASAHYFVNFDGAIWQSVEDYNIAWHVGASSYKHPTCRNANAIGIEMCVRNNGNWYFEQATVNAAIELTKELMNKYNIPKENVLRHYDVTGKNCPEPFVRNSALWTDFKNKLSGGAAPSTPSPTPSPSGSYLVKVTANDGLNVRKGPGTGYGISTAISKNEVFTIIETQGNWGRLKSGAGWICLDYTSKVSGVATPPTPPPTKSTYLVKINATSGLNVRKGPGTGYQKTTAVSHGQVFTIVETSGNWGRLKSGAGWICLDYTKRV